MVTLYKPRGPQKPSMTLDGGYIRPNQLVTFLKDAQKHCEQAGEEDSAFRLEMIAEYFEKDFRPGQPLSFRGMYAGF